MRLFTSPRYSVEIGEHVFATSKFARVSAELIARGLALPEDFTEPDPASPEDLALVHTPVWVDKVLYGRLTREDTELLELPYSPELALAHRIHSQGTVEACREALRGGLGIHVGGGSHHAMPDHGEGYCVFNDIALGVSKALAEGRARRAMIVDLDVHHGNGTAVIFARETRVFTFSMHQQNNFPPVKPASSLDVGLENGVGDSGYLETLRGTLPRLFDQESPELVVYQAGADPYERDQLGGLGITEAGLRERDRIVFREAFRRGLPVAVTLGGGYAPEVRETVRIHANTLEEAILLHRRLWPGDRS